MLFRYFFVELSAIALFFLMACSGDNGSSPSSNDGNSGLEAPIDSIRVIDPETGDTILIFDTTTVQKYQDVHWVGNSALVITEISPYNMDWLDEDGDDPAWVEIYNAGNVSANLKHYSLVENLKDPRKWEFGDELIAAKTARIVFCDKKNITSLYGETQSEIKGADGKTYHKRLHTNWKMDKSGGTIYLIDGSNGIRDSVTFPELRGGVSWGIVDGGEWKYFEKPTPEKPNTASQAYEGFSEKVSLPAGGFYSEVITLQPVTSAEGTVRCTFDGSIPTAQTEEFTEPKEIESNKVVRCGVFSAGKITKDIATETYFIGESVKMPVVSISVDPSFMSNYYNIETNLSGCGPSCNPPILYDDREFPVHVEYFANGDASKEAAFEIDAGLSLMGGYSRLEPKKSVAIVMREEYQPGWLHYPLFETRKGVNDKYKGFNLRNNGNRFVSDYMEDALGGAMLEGSGVDYQRSRQVVVFYNGRYKGIHDMRERFNKNYVETNYGIDANTVNVVKHIGKEVKASSGSADGYLSMLNYINSNDMSDSKNYGVAKTMLDVGNFADYMAAEIYYHNGDWPDNNVRAWSSANQPWKFMIYDLDHGFSWKWPSNGFSSGTDMFWWIEKGGSNSCSSAQCFASIYNRLIKNADFKRMFINRSAVMLERFLTGARADSIAGSMYATMNEGDIERDLEKYEHRRNAYESFDASGASLVLWAKKREASVREDYSSRFKLSGMISVTIESSGAGTVLMEGMNLPGSTSTSTNYTGTFFGGNKMELTAVPSAGATFAGWSDGSSENPRVFSVSDKMKITAKFK